MIRMLAATILLIATFQDGTPDVRRVTEQLRALALSWGCAKPRVIVEQTNDRPPVLQVTVECEK